MSAEDELSFKLSEDKAWRIRELSEIVRACNDAGGIRREALVRASIPVIYAHWEGYFVCATNSYLSFVANMRISLGLLRDEFWTLSIRRRYKHQQIAGDIHFNRFLLQIRSESDRTFKKGDFERINGMSNLNSDVLKWCCSQIGLNADAFSDYFEFIDNKLIHRRNFIAHGASHRVELDSVAEYRDKVIEMMRITETEIENSVFSSSYLARGRKGSL